MTQPAGMICDSRSTGSKSTEATMHHSDLVFSNLAQPSRRASPDAGSEQAFYDAMQRRRVRAPRWATAAARWLVRFAHAPRRTAAEFR